jgi:hypothetical protein
MQYQQQSVLGIAPCIRVYFLIISVPTLRRLLLLWLSRLIPLEFIRNFDMPHINIYAYLQGSLKILML